MFRVADVGRQWVPVDLPQGDETVRVHLLFDLVPRAEMRARERALTERSGAGLLERAKDIKTVADMLAVFDETTQAEDTDVADLVARTHDWRGFGGGEDGDEVPFTTERFAALLAYDYLFRTLRRALYQASREGVAKNSEPGPGGSPAPAQA